MDVSRKKYSSSRETINKSEPSNDGVVLRAKRPLRKTNSETPSNGYHAPLKATMIYRTQCPCASHFNKQLMERSYDIEVDRLFDLIFGANDFVRTYRTDQHFFDQTETQWEVNEATKCRKRILTYKVPYDLAFIGKSTIFTREEQVISHEAPASHYVVETEVSNQGVKFGDAFCLIIRYCLVQISAKTTRLSVTALVDYRKSVNTFIKHIIEHNAYSASQEGLKDLNNRLNRLLHLKLEKRRSLNDEVPTLSTVIEEAPRTPNETHTTFDQYPLVMPTTTSLQPIHGSHQWINTHEHVRVENFSHFQPHSPRTKPLLIPSTTENKPQQRPHFIRTFDVQLQVTDGQLQPIVRYGVFPSTCPIKSSPPIQIHQSSQTMDFMAPEMDMDQDNYQGRSYGRATGSSERNSNQSSSYHDQRSGGTSGGGSSGGNGDGNGFNPNRNNGSRRPPEDPNNNDDNDDDTSDRETDESLARRLGFRPIDNETIRTIGRLRNLTNQQSFTRLDLENLEYLLDELIRIQHLESFTVEQLELIVHHLRLHRPLRSRSEALSFIQDRLPRRNTRAQNETSSNVFNIWRERERRARLDSKDSLEDEANDSSGQQLHDVTEINHPTPPILISSNGRSRVRQMARDIDTRSVSTRNGDSHRSPSPPPVQQERHTPVEDHRFTSTNNNNNNNHNGHSADQRRVRQMVDRFESSSTSADQNGSRKVLNKRSIQDHQDDNSSSGGFRVTRRDMIQNNDRDETFIYREETSPDHVFIYRNQQHQTPSISSSTGFELNRDEILKNSRRTANGTTMDEYISSLLPNTETSVSMVRDIRARLYEDDTGIVPAHSDRIPMKVDVETLYILEQRAAITREIPVNHRQDFGSQTNLQTSPNRPTNRPVGTQVSSMVEQQTVAAQTTDTLHRANRERPSLITPNNVNNGENNDDDDDELEEGETSKIIRTTTTTSRYEVKRRQSSHTSEDAADGDGAGETVIYIDDKDNFELKSSNETLPVVPDQSTSFGQVTSRIRIDQLRNLNRQIADRHSDQQYYKDEPRSTEVYEIHTRGACKCLVVSYEEKTQHGSETLSEKKIRSIERSYTDDELYKTELHVIVTSSDQNYRLVRRDYGNEGPIRDRDERILAVNIHYYSRDGQRMSTERGRLLEHLPLFVRCEIEYELNHYGSAQLIILSIDKADRRQKSSSLKKEIADEIIAHSRGRYPPNCPELEREITRQFAETVPLLHIVDYTTRDNYQQTNSTDLRRVSRFDVTTSLRLVQHFRMVIHRLCQQYRSHLRLTTQAEQQRHMILVSQDEYYLYDLAQGHQESSTSTSTTTTTTIQTNHQQIIPQVTETPFDYAKYRRELEAQQKLIEQRYRQHHQQQQQQQKQKTNVVVPPPSGHPNEAEFYWGSGRREMIEREVRSMRESIRPHEHAPPQYKHEPRRRTVSISYSGAQRYVRARIIHVKDYFDESASIQQRQDHKNAKEQELFVRVDDFVNEDAAKSLRRSYSRDFLAEDGPRSRIRYIRIPGETIRIEEKTTYEYQGVMYANLPYSLRYWNILQILDREAREGRALGSTLPQIIVNDPYQTVIPPLTQQEIRQTAEQILTTTYPAKTYTDQTLRWFLSRDNRTEIESTKYLQTLNDYRYQQQQQQHEQQIRQQEQERQREQHKRTDVRVEGQQRIGTKNKYFVTETLVRYEKMPDRLVPVTTTDRSKSTDNLHYHHHHQQQQQQQKQQTQQPHRHYQSNTNLAYGHHQQKSADNLHLQSPSKTAHVHQQSFQSHQNRSQSQPRPPAPLSIPVRVHLPQMNNPPLSRHQSVHELRATSHFSHPPSPTPSLHSLHTPQPQQQHPQQTQHRRPVAYNTRYHPRPPSQSQNPLFTEIIDSQTGQRIVTTSQEQLPTEVLGLLNRYNLQQF